MSSISTLPTFALFPLLYIIISHFASSVSATVPLSCSNEAPRLFALQSCYLTGNSSLKSHTSDPYQVTYVDFDEEESENLFPWSHRPVCTQYFDDLKSELCVYTNSSFSHGRGVSIFTTPSIAHEFAALQPFQDSTVLHRVNEDTQHWYTQEVLGKGIAMMAKTKLKRGDHLTAFSPVLIVNLQKILPVRENEMFLRRAIEQLPPSTRSAYLGLSRMYDNPDVKIQDILKSNAFEIQVGGMMHLAIFPEPARMNHDCAPNAQYYLDASLLTHHVYVTRPIAQEEEITISYTSPFQQTAARQSHLLKSFHFTCSCQLCKTGASFDDDLPRINNLQNSLGDWADRSSATRQDAVELIRLYKSYRLDSFLDLPYGFAALTYNSFGDARGAVRYAHMAAEAVKMKNGPFAADYNLWESIQKDPEGHWSWRYRLR